MTQETATEFDRLAEMDAEEIVAGVEWEVGDWVRTKSGLARLIHMWEDGRTLRQYFEPMRGCPNGCLDGDGGYGGYSKMYKVPSGETPHLAWCGHCEEEVYFPARTENMESQR